MVDHGVLVDKFLKAGTMSCSRKTRATRCLSSELDVKGSGGTENSR